MSVHSPRAGAPSAGDDASAVVGPAAVRGGTRDAKATSRSSAGRRRVRTWRLAGAVVAGAVVLLVATSNLYGRAEPTGRYRPDLPADALATGCYPLPSGVLFGFPYQVRSDEDLPGGRRHLLLQFDLIDPTSAREQVAAAFGAAGFRRTSVGDSTADLALTRDAVGQPPTTVRVTVRPIPGVSQDAVVRGTVELDLPSVPIASAATECTEPSSTKRFADEAVAQ